MKHLKIGMKITAAFGVIIFLSVSTACIAIFGFYNASHSFDSFYSDGFRITNQGMDMRRILNVIAKNIGYISMERDNEKAEIYIAEATKEFDNLKNNILVMEEKFQGNSKLQSMINDCKLWLDESMEYRDEVFDYARSNRREEAAIIYFEKFYPHLLNINNNLTLIYDIAMENAVNDYKSAQATKTQIIAILFLSSIIQIIATIVLAIYLTKIMNQPILRMDSAAKELVNGNLNTQLSYCSQDELENLSKSIPILITNIKEVIEDVGYTLSQLSENDFTVDSRSPELCTGDFKTILDSTILIIRQLSDALSQISISSSLVENGSNQAAVGAQHLALGTTEPSESIVKVTSGIGQISASVQANSAATEEFAAAAEEKSLVNRFRLKD